MFTLRKWASLSAVKHEGGGMKALATTTGRRGGPLLMLVLLVSVWTGARAVWWENPFAQIGEILSVPMTNGPTAFSVAAPIVAGVQHDPLAFALPGLPTPLAVGWVGDGLARSGVTAGIDPQLAAAHQLLWMAALRDPLPSPGGASTLPAQAFAATDNVPFLPVQPNARGGVGGRWSVDNWAFWRQGSNGAPISQGRVPIYGASQVGAVLQYRLGPEGRGDPRLYARAYRALVRRGESELALGASVRPMARIPVRVAGEVRFTDGAFSNEVRPSAYAVTEFAPVRLPFGAQLEAYGQAGWVGGASATAFADGQASVTRELEAIAGATENSLRLSVGAAAWGGAQVDAQRLDLGPTMRLDLTVGDMPARLSLDWRERVGGQAGPDSGLAATLSARF
jgi:hypothetical protein